MTFPSLEKSLTPKPSPRLIQHFSSIIDGFDLLICDVWGVLHNGVAAFAPAHQALQMARAQGVQVILLSNAPRPHSVVIPQLERLGVPRNAYDAIVTSGDITRSLISERKGQSLYLLGPERDLSVIAGLDAPRTSLEEADYVLCTGLFNDDIETPEDYDPILQNMLRRELILLCANPDLVVEKGDKLIYCAGAIAERYQDMGGKITLIGKPFKIAYEGALAAAEKLGGGPPPLSRILGIGDAIRTDIKGAEGFGIASLFLANGIHAAELLGEGHELDKTRLSEFMQKQSVQPNFTARHLEW